MPPRQIAPKAAEKPWGRRQLPAPFERWAGSEPIGEIIFEPEAGTDPELLVKFLFTAEKLSIQVHPDDETAKAAGLRRGKDEAWLVLDAEEGATIGYGLKRELTPTEMRHAVQSGEIEALIDWRPVKAGDCLYSPAGTVHAIGAGLSLLEIQQNCDVTYRLYDYGRPRELHIEPALRVANPGPASDPLKPVHLGDGHAWLGGGSPFQVEQFRGAGEGLLNPQGRSLWLVVLVGSACLGGGVLSPGEVWTLDQPCPLQLDREAELILAYPGSSIVPVWTSSA